jgi:hypothetical protein
MTILSGEEGRPEGKMKLTIGNRLADVDGRMFIVGAGCIACDVADIAGRGVALGKRISVVSAGELTAAGICKGMGAKVLIDHTRPEMRRTTRATQPTLLAVCAWFLSLSLLTLDNVFAIAVDDFASLSFIGGQRTCKDEPRSSSIIFSSPAYLRHSAHSVRCC